MYDGKFLHLPVIDRDGCLVAIADVINVTHAAIFIVGTGEDNSEAANSMMQRFLDSAMQFAHLNEVEDTRSEDPFKYTCEVSESGRNFSGLHQSRTFTFKLEDRRGMMHRFVCDASSLTDLMTCVFQRVGEYVDHKNLPQILYEDEDHDKVLIASDVDLAAAINHARAVGWKGLRLHLNYPHLCGRRRAPASGAQRLGETEVSGAGYGAVAAAAVVVASLGVTAFCVKRMS